MKDSVNPFWGKISMFIFLILFAFPQVNAQQTITGESDPEW